MASFANSYQIVSFCSYAEICWETYGVGEVDISHECHTSGWQYTDALNLAPLLKVSGNDFLNVVRCVYPAHVESPVDAHETSNTTHVVSVVAEFVSSKAVDIGGENVAQTTFFLHARIWQTVEVLAVLTFRTEAASEVDTEIAAGDGVG
jgi:hypothetical protein